jgi:type I restriction enzyme M protein
LLLLIAELQGSFWGKVGMTTEVHDGAIGNNNLIRVIINDPGMRDYVYQYLRSELGQTLLLRNVYGTNQDHIEPDDVKDIPVLVPREAGDYQLITNPVREVVQLRERAAILDQQASTELDRLLTNAFRRVVLKCLLRFIARKKVDWPAGATMRVPIRICS